MRFLRCVPSLAFVTLLVCALGSARMPDGFPRDAENWPAEFKEHLLAEQLGPAFLALRQWEHSAQATAAGEHARALLYAKLDMPAATIEAAGRGLALSPEAELAVALRELKASAHASVGEAAAAWNEFTQLLATVRAGEERTREWTKARWAAYADLAGEAAWRRLTARIEEEADAAPDDATLKLRLARLYASAGQRTRAGDVLDEANRLGVTSAEHVLLRLALDLDQLEAGNAEPSEEDIERFTSRLEEARELGARPAALEYLSSSHEQIVTTLNETGRDMSLIGGVIHLEAGQEDALMAQTRTYLGDRTAKAQLALGRTAKAWEALENVSLEATGPAESMARLQTIVHALTEGRAQLKAVVTDGSYLHGALEGLTNRLYDEGLASDDRPAVWKGVAIQPLQYALRDFDLAPIAEAFEKAGKAEARGRMLLQQADRIVATQPLRELALSTAAPERVLQATSELFLTSQIDAPVWLARFQAALRLNSLSETAHAAVMSVVLGTGSPAYDAAEQWLLGALAQADVHAVEGTRALLALMPSEALDLADAALVLNPAQPEALDVRWQALARLGGSEAAALALADFWKAQTGRATDLLSAMNLAYQAGQWTLLHSLARAAVREQPGESEGYYFESLAVRALALEKAAPEADLANAVSPYAHDTQLTQHVVASVRSNDNQPSSYAAMSALEQLLGADDEPAGLRTWLALCYHAQKPQDLREKHTKLRAGLTGPDASFLDLQLGWLEGRIQPEAFLAQADSTGFGGTARFALGWLVQRFASPEEAVSHLMQAVGSDAPAPFRVAANAILVAQGVLSPEPSVRVLDPVFVAGNERDFAAARIAAPGQWLEVSGATTLETLGGHRSLRVRSARAQGSIVVAPAVLTPTDNDAWRLWEFESIDLNWEGYEAAHIPVRTMVSLSDTTNSGLPIALAGNADVVGGTFANGLFVLPGATTSALRSQFVDGPLQVDGTLHFTDGSLYLKQSGNHLGATGTLTAKGTLIDTSFALNDESKSENGRFSFVSGSRARFSNLTVIAPTEKTFVLEGDAEQLVFSNVRVFGGNDALRKQDGGDVSLAGATIHPLPPFDRVPTHSVTDQETLLQAASAAKSGDVIALAPGTYHLTQPLSLPPGILLISANPDEPAVLHVRYGTTPLISVSGAGAIGLRGLTFVMEPAYHQGNSGTFTPFRGIMTALALSETFAVIENCDFKWWRFQDADPSIALAKGGGALVRNTRFDRGHLASAPDTSTWIDRARGEQLVFAGPGVLQVAHNEVSAFTVLDPASRFVGPDRGMVFRFGAGSEFEKARYRLARTTRDAAWERARRQLEEAWPAASNRSERSAVLKTFSTRVAAAAKLAQTPEEEQITFGLAQLTPKLRQHLDESGVHYFNGVIRLVPTTALNRLATDVRTAIGLYADGASHARASANSDEADRAFAVYKAFPPGTRGFNELIRARQRGDSIDDAQRSAQRVTEEHRLFLEEQRAYEIRRAAELAAIAESKRVYAERQRQLAREIASRPKPRGVVSNGSYVPLYAQSYSAPSAPQWTPSQRDRDINFRSHLDRQINSAVFGR